MLHLSSPARLGLAVGGLSLLGAAIAVPLIDDRYVSGPKHESRFAANAIPVEMEWSGDLKYKDFYFDVGQTSPLRISIWQPDQTIEAQGFQNYSTNVDTLTRAVMVNQKIKNGPRDTLSVCDLSGYGRVGYRDFFHHFIVEDLLIHTPEYDQQTRFNVTTVTCKNASASPTDPIWEGMLRSSETYITEVPNDGYGRFHVLN